MTFEIERPPKLKDRILRLLNEHRVMAISTNRADGWSQATLVGYVNDGFFLYCFVALNSQKYANILRDPRVSIAIGSDAVFRPLQEHQWSPIKANSTTSVDCD